MAKRGSEAVKVVSVSAWQIRDETPRGARRAAAAADSFIAKLAQSRRVAIVGTYQAELPLRRGIEDQPLVVEISPTTAGCYVLMARHATGAITFSLPGPARA